MTGSRHLRLVVGATLCASALMLAPLPLSAWAVDVPVLPSDVAPAEIVTSPSPHGSPVALPPLLPPAGLPTAPPPDAIKPVVPQAEIDHPELEPVRAKPNGGGR